MPKNGFPKMFFVSHASEDDDPEKAQELDAFYASVGTDAKQWDEMEGANSYSACITMPLAQSLYCTDTPLTADQARQLATIIYSQFFTPKDQDGQRHLTLGADNWDSLIEQSRPILSQSQLDALNALKPRVEYQTYDANKSNAATREKSK